MRGRAGCRRRRADPACRDHPNRAAPSRPEAQFHLRTPVEEPTHRTSGLLSTAVRIHRTAASPSSPLNTAGPTRRAAAMASRHSATPHDRHRVATPRRRATPQRRRQVEPRTAVPQCREAELPRDRATPVRRRTAAPPSRHHRMAEALPRARAGPPTRPRITPLPATPSRATEDPRRTDNPAASNEPPRSFAATAPTRSNSPTHRSPRSRTKHPRECAKPNPSTRRRNNRSRSTIPSRAPTPPARADAAALHHRRLLPRHRAPIAPRARGASGVLSGGSWCFCCSWSSARSRR
ncbi:hypothetical protein APR09_002365 [Nocardia amikacinitolerans]|nr:hypothetical protein [Nocardia amikacinitolerans]